MADKVFNGRIIHKNDIEENWEKAINFIPKKSELIIYNPDNTHAQARVKVGDGVTKVNDLPFIIDDVKPVTTVNGKTGASIVLTGEDIAISADDNTTVKERVGNVQSAASTAHNTATARGTLAQQALNATKWTELWVNNNIDTFNEQTISNIDTWSYSWFIIIYGLYKGDYVAQTSFLAKKGPNISPLVPLGEPIDLSYRNAEINDSGVTFKNCYSFTPGSSQQYVRNERLIPIAILGIHGNN